jgi:hypothetical protein
MLNSFIALENLDDEVGINIVWETTGGNIQNFSQRESRFL